MSRTFVINEFQSGIRIDKFLSEEMADLSRSYIQKLIKDSHVLANDNPVKANYKLSENDTIYIDENVLILDIKDR